MTKPEDVRKIVLALEDEEFLFETGPAHFADEGRRLIPNAALTLPVYRGRL